MLTHTFNNPSLRRIAVRQREGSPLNPQRRPGSSSSSLTAEERCNSPRYGSPCGSPSSRIGSLRRVGSRSLLDNVECLSASCRGSPSTITKDKDVSSWMPGTSTSYSFMEVSKFARHVGNEEKEFGYPKDFDERFELLEQLGRGGYGVVHKARQRHTGDLFAVKVLEKSKLVTSESLDRVRREVLYQTKTGPSLSVAYLFRVFEDAERVYMVMELCRGGPLWPRAASENYNEAQVTAGGEAGAGGAARGGAVPRARRRRAGRQAAELPPPGGGGGLAAEAGGLRPRRRLPPGGGGGGGDPQRARRHQLLHGAGGGGAPHLLAARAQVRAQGGYLECGDHGLPAADRAAAVQDPARTGRARQRRRLCRHRPQRGEHRSVTRWRDPPYRSSCLNPVHPLLELVHPLERSSGTPPLCD
mmetsp:Transcript_8172/g.16821  ORF Transcript_8172/g.16821 Transcript_8172/m.16821 type:complete len:415 (+) Transcript_8172:378-1622(+)